MKFTKHFRDILVERKIKLESKEVSPGVILDFDEKGRVVGVEFLNISERANQQEISNLQFQTA